MNHLGVAEELERTVALRSGVPVRLRPIRSDDAPRLVSFYDRLSADTAYRRFFTRMRTLPPELAHHLANVDHQRRLAVVAEPCEGQIPVVIGVARSEPTDSPTTAELALVVEDAWQGLGLGAILLEEILRAAGRRGVCEFRADVLTSNGRMLRLLAHHVDVTRRTRRQEVTEIFFRHRALTATKPC
jgi:GNAT superfamily N-acetyltransferase